VRQASPATTASVMPRTAPSRPSAAAVAAVIIRRVVVLAPVAVSVRRSRAVSLRITPTGMASTPRAITMPSAVAPSAILPRQNIQSPEEHGVHVQEIDCDDTGSLWDSRTRPQVLTWASMRLARTR
jgi:hypothetical protein